MRALMFATGFSLALVPAFAAAADRQRPRPAYAAQPEAPPLPLRIRPIRLAPPAFHEDLAPRLAPGGGEADDPLQASTVNIGPLSARLGGTARKAHIARYRLEGMDILGGSVSGTFDGRGGRIYLRWPPSDDE